MRSWRSTFLGTVEEYVEKLRTLKDLGVGRFDIYLMHDAMEETLRACGEEVMPGVGAAA